MDTEKIKELAAILENSSLNYMEVSEGEFHLKLGKSAPPFAAGAAASAGAGFAPGTAAGAGTIGLAAGAGASATGLATGVPISVEAAGLAAARTAEVTAPVPDRTAVKSPMVGVFYAASSPDAEPFVQKGQAVTKGQVLCIIEAMKLMNEITAEQDGVIAEVCVKDGDIVEFGQPLFYME